MSEYLTYGRFGILKSLALEITEEEFKANHSKNLLGQTDEIWSKIAKEQARVKPKEPAKPKRTRKRKNEKEGGGE